MTSEQRAMLRAQLQRIPRSPVDQTIDELRSAFDAMMLQIPVRADVSVTESKLGGRPVLEVRSSEHESGARGLILYIHGGGFISGSPCTALGLTAELVARTGFAAVSVDYRLAPEVPFPGGLEDCMAVYRAALVAGASADEIVLVGDSAGGNLALSLGLMAKGEDLPLPAAIVAFSPSADMTRSGASMARREDRDPFFTRGSLRQTTSMYLGGADPALPLASPAVTGDFSGMPPLLLQVGTDEVLLDDAVRIAERARDAEVDVILDVVAGVPHVFPSMVAALDEAGDALDRAALFIQQHVKQGT